MKIFVALVHLVFATTWLGGAFFYTGVLQPKLNALPTAERRALARSLRATMTPLLAISAFLTIASGLVMMVQLHGLHPGSFSHSRWGLSLIIGALASVGALAIAFAIEGSVARQDARLDEGARTNRRAPLFRRERSARFIALALLFLALATMAVARYS
jgi:putative copper export protein